MNSADTSVPLPGSDGYRRLLLLLGVFSFVIVLHVAYVTRISPFFAYMGFTYVSPMPTDTAVTLAFALAPTLFMPLRATRPSQILGWFLYAFVLIPAVMMITYVSGSSVTYLVFDSLLVLALLLLTGISGMPSLRVPRMATSTQGFITIVLLLSATANLLILLRFGLSATLPSFSEVYTVRTGFGASLSEAGRGMNYLTNWQGNVLNPLLVGLGYYRRSWLLAAVGIVSQLYLYSISGLRSLLLIPAALVVVIAWSLRAEGHSFATRFVGLLTVGSAVALASDFAFSSIQGTSLVIRRGVLTAGLNTSYYLNVFTDNPPALLGHSILKGIVRSPYIETPVAIVASRLGRAGSPNVNLFGDGYANFGYLGVLIVIGALLLLMRFIDSAAADRPLPLVLLVLGVPLLSLAQSAFLTTMLTHGGLFALALLVIMPPETSLIVSSERGRRQISRTAFETKQRSVSRSSRSPDDTR